MKRQVVVLLGAAVGICGSMVLRYSFKEATGPVSEPIGHEKKAKRDDEERRKIAWRIIAPRIEIAQEEALKAAERRVQQVAAFFSERRGNVPNYADRVLSFRSKWELAKSKAPGGDKEAHKRFLTDEFNKIVFSDAELHHTVTSAVEDYVKDIKAIENALLIKIRADLVNIPEFDATLPELKSDTFFSKRFTDLMGGLSHTAGSDAKMDIGRLIGSEIAAAIMIRVGSAVATRLGVSGTILGASAAASPGTAGISIAAGIILDQIIGWVINYFYNPKTNIEKELTRELDRLSNLIVRGDEETRGLRQELESLAAERSKVREAALRSMILQKGT